MLRLTLKSVRGHLLRFVLTMVAVTLGTALVAGTFVFTDSIDRTFDELFDSAGAGLDVQVRGQAGGESVDGTQLRSPLPLTLQDTPARRGRRGRGWPPICRGSRCWSARTAPRCATAPPPRSASPTSRTTRH